MNINKKRKFLGITIIGLVFAVLCTTLVVQSVQFKKISSGYEKLKQKRDCVVHQEKIEQLTAENAEMQNKISALESAKSNGAVTRAQKFIDALYTNDNMPANYQLTQCKPLVTESFFETLKGQLSTNPDTPEYYYKTGVDESYTYFAQSNKENQVETASIVTVFVETEQGGEKICSNVLVRLSLIYNTESNTWLVKDMLSQDEFMVLDY